MIFTNFGRARQFFLLLLSISAIGFLNSCKDCPPGSYFLKAASVDVISLEVYPLDSTEVNEQSVYYYFYHDSIEVNSEGCHPYTFSVYPLTSVEVFASDTIHFEATYPPGTAISDYFGAGYSFNTTNIIDLDKKAEQTGHIWASSNYFEETEVSQYPFFGILTLGELATPFAGTFTFRFHFSNGQFVDTTTPTLNLY